MAPDDATDRRIGDGLGGSTPGVRPMKAIVAGLLALALALAASACSAPVPDPLGRACWLHTLDGPDRPANQIMLCRTGPKARLRIHFPNNPWLLRPPTTCSAHGQVRDEADGAMDFQFRVGWCQNGRKLRAERYACMGDGRELLCHSDGLRLVFHRHPEQS